VITKVDMSNKLKQLLLGINISDKVASDKAFQMFFQWLPDKSDELDEEARKIVSKMLESMFDSAKEKLASMPDSPLKRQGLRIVKMASGVHFDSNSLVQILEKRTEKDLPILKDIRDIFIRHLQIILNLLSDVIANPLRGVNDFAKLSLFYLCVDELLVAFHLAQHSFINQAYTHIRSIFEALDKIELFETKPEWSKLWASDNPKDEKKKWKELSPSAVREKLGKVRYDPLYSYFSEMGPHGSFKNVQSRSGMIKKSCSKGRKEFRVWLGGAPFEHNIVSVNSFLLYSLVAVLSKIAIIYGRYLNIEETDGILHKIQVDYRSFFENHFIKWAEREGKDIKPMVELIRNLPSVD